MTRRLLVMITLALLAGALTTGPTVAARPTSCTLTLDVAATHEYGETVVLHVSGLPGFGGIDIFTTWRNRTDEAHLFLIFGITEFDWIYQSYDPENPSPPLEPGMYRVHAVDATGCEVHTTFRVTR